VEASTRWRLLLRLAIRRELQRLLPAGGRFVGSRLSRRRGLA